MQSRVDKLVHDVRGTLNSISMNAELARLLSQQGANPDKLRHCLDVILRECHQCNGLMEGFREDVRNQTSLEQD